jgi:hypothetical protein
VAGTLLRGLLDELRDEGVSVASEKRSRADDALLGMIVGKEVEIECVNMTAETCLRLELVVRGVPGISVVPFPPDTNCPSSVNCAGGSSQFVTSLMYAQAKAISAAVSTECSVSHAKLFISRLRPRAQVVYCSRYITL